MNAVLHPNQSALARELGLAAEQMATAEAAVAAIEARLGEESMQLRAQWFVISVLRHLRKAKWLELDDSGLDAQRQRELAAACLAVAGFANSLGTVTKDYRSKFRLVGFASSKNIERGTLATGTKAYKLAAEVLRAAGLIEAPAGRTTSRPQARPARQSGADPKPGSKSKPDPRSKARGKPGPSESKAGKRPADEPADTAVEKRVEKRVEQSAEKPAKKSAKAAAAKSVVARRAKRRGYAADSAGLAGVEEEAPAAEHPAMSEEEFARLNAALSKDDNEVVQRNWVDQSDEDRWSRILGILAGLGFFLFIAFLFL